MTCQLLHHLDGTRDRAELVDVLAGNSPARSKIKTKATGHEAAAFVTHDPAEVVQRGVVDAGALAHADQDVANRL